MAEPWVRAILLDSLGLKAGERVLIMADRSLWDAGEALVAAAEVQGAGDVRLAALPEPGVTFTVVPTRFVRTVSQADLLVSLRSGLDLQDEDAHMRAAMGAFRQAGRGRWASLAQVDDRTLRQVLGSGLDAVAIEAERLAARLRTGRAVRLTSAVGTDLTLVYGDRPLQLETGRIREPGAISNLPAGEVYVAPLEESAEGRLVVDLCLGDLWLDRPVTLIFERGRVVKAEGGWAARELRARLGDDGWAWTVGELGLGANPHIRPQGRVALDEKALGTAHIALGGNRSFGGQNPASTHYDCVIADPQIELLA